MIADRDHQAGGARPAARRVRRLRDQGGEAAEDRGGGQIGAGVVGLEEHTVGFRPVVLLPDTARSL